MKKNIKSQRQLRIAEQLKHLISEIIIQSDFSNPKIREKTITVTEVNLSPDLKKASVFVIPENNKQSLIEDLNKETFLFQKQIAKKLKLRFVPKIYFYFDKSMDYANHIEKLLKDPKVIKDL